MSDKMPFAFKKAGGLELRADVFGISGGPPRPAVLFFHGGALILSHRARIGAAQKHTYLSAGCTLVSADYRLAPETKLPEIIEDAKAAYHWVRTRGPALCNIDPARIALAGRSAGAYLAMTLGASVTPKPKAIVSFYGYGDIAGGWYSRPDPFYCSKPAVSKEEAYAAVGKGVICEVPPSDTRGRYLYYLYLRQNGLWPLEVGGHDPNTEPEAFDQFCPIRNVGADFPPTILLHGEADTDVPCEQSVMMARELARAGIEHELVIIPGGSHGLDDAGGAEPQVARALKRVAKFLNKHLA